MIFDFGKGDDESTMSKPIKDLSYHELEEILWEKRDEQKANLISLEEKQDELEWTDPREFKHRPSVGTWETNVGFYGKEGDFNPKKIGDVKCKLYTDTWDKFGPKNAPDVFTYLDYMVHEHNIQQFTLVPYLPKNYEEDGVELDEDAMPPPHVVNCYTSQYATPKWKEEVNKYFQEFDWGILEVGLSSLVMTTEGLRHMLMLDMDGRGFQSTQGDEILVPALDTLIFDGVIDPLQTMVLRSTKSFHVYDCKRLYTRDEWIKTLAGCLYHKYDAHVIVDKRWIANVLYLRDYGIIRVTANTKKYRGDNAQHAGNIERMKYIPQCLTAPEQMSKYFVRLIDAPEDPAKTKDVKTSDLQDND